MEAHTFIDNLFRQGNASPSQQSWLWEMLLETHIAKDLPLCNDLGTIRRASAKNSGNAVGGTGKAPRTVKVAHNNDAADDLMENCGPVDKENPGSKFWILKDSNTVKLDTDQCDLLQSKHKHDHCVFQDMVLHGLSERFNKRNHSHKNDRTVHAKKQTEFVVKACDVECQGCVLAQVSCKPETSTQATNKKSDKNDTVMVKLLREHGPKNNRPGRPFWIAKNANAKAPANKPNWHQPWPAFCDLLLEGLKSRTAPQKGSTCAKCSHLGVKMAPMSVTQEREKCGFDLCTLGPKDTNKARKKKSACFAFQKKCLHQNKRSVLSTSSPCPIMV